MSEKHDLYFQPEPGFTAEEAYEEASRCLNCKIPSCQRACPLKVDIPGFINAIKEKDLETAMMIIRDCHPLPAMCGYACPSSKFCEGHCALAKKGKPIAIAKLKRFVADWEYANSINAQRWAKPRDVAVVGGGPAGITAAYELLKLGHRVTILEASNLLGGLLRKALPDFRLPRELVDIEVQRIKRFGVRVETGEILGKNITLKDLKRVYDAILIAGAPYKSKKLNIPGEELPQVYSGIEFLIKLKSLQLDEVDKIKVGEKVVVIGGGNVSIDVARSCLRLGAKEVIIIYRKGPEEMPALKKEVDKALEEGAKIVYWSTPIEIKGENGRVTAINIQNPNGQETLPVDEVYVTIGYTPNPESFKIPELKLTEKGLVEIDPNTCETSIEGVFAAGDVAYGPSTIAEAMASGKKAAWGIHKYLSRK
ncbi:NAD(P)-dependent oxidoreductase [Thermoanaerobacter sp. A7A]|uniref:NAD(P)-dependent oxidoreductase n=1 Tax=Thermoanaerobacter sp. A7A TaxID=1350366 RepID=UPI00041BE70B|nr:NAD(P)-dependent oxidoreductase [Thermoanaerobacter sp. A7A]